MKRAGRRNLLVILMLCVVMTLFFLPSSVFAAQVNDSTTTITCANGGTDSATSDISSCLPSGRWGNYVGEITSRTEPYSGSDVAGWFSNVKQTISSQTHIVLPNILMQLTQVCWSSALSISQFAASFEPMKQAGANIDSAVSTMVTSLMDGGIPATIAVLGIVAWVGAAGFQIGTVKEASKRIVIMVLCFASITMLGAGAAKTGKNATEPATGSPWWVVQTINNTINKLSVNLDLDGMADSDKNMMSYHHAANGAKTNCQDYLYFMHQAYDEQAKSNGNQDTSNVTKAINRIWEETSLRSFVTMQYGNPQTTGTSSFRIAENARQGYCHVLEMKANTNTTIQKDLTNKAMALHISDQRAKWLFSVDGWVDPRNPYFTDKPLERENATYLSRAGVFWETCGTKRNQEIYARAGWATLINNLGDTGTKNIKNGSTKVRVKIDDLDNVKPTNGGKGVMDAKQNGSEDETIQQTTSVCQTILKQGSVIFSRSTDINKEDDGTYKDQQNDTNWGDSATVGWRFDVPNVSGTWSEANLRDAQDDSTVTGGAKKTIDYMYGNNNVDTLGACGTLIGGIVNLVVWGLLSLVLILTKLMLIMMALFLVVTFLVQAFPIGEEPKKALKNWATYTCQLSMVGALYGALGALATFICGLTLKFTSASSGSFTYQLIAGLSPVLALSAIGMFCSKVLKCGNPFSVNALMGMAGGTAMASGLRKGMHMIGQYRMIRAMRGGFRRGGNGVGRLSTNGTGAGMAHNGARQSETVLSKMSRAQQEALSQGDRNLMNRNAKEFEAIQTRGRGSKNWARMDKSTVRGSLAGAKLHFEDSAGKFKGRLNEAVSKFHGEDNTEAFAHRIAQRHPGMSLNDVQRKAQRMNHLNNAGRKLQGAARVAGAGAAMAGAGLAFAARAAKSAPLRNVAARGAKVAAKAAVTGALFSNPITAPLGLIAAGKLATDRDAWHGAAQVGKGIAHAGGKGLQLGHDALQKRLDRTQRIIDMANGDAPLPSPFTGTGDGNGGAGGPVPTPSGSDNGAGSAMPTSDGAPTETIPTSDGAQQAPRMGENEAFNQVRAGMMADFVDNQHMSQEDAEQAFQEAVASGEVDNSVQAYMSQNNQSPIENATTQPEMNANQPVYNTETGEIVGETLPSGTMDAAVSAASTWQNATDNATPMPESVNNALQQAYMRENPVQQSPEEHLRMAQEEWTATTGLPGSTMPSGAERAMNPNGIQPSKEFTVDSGRTQQQGSVQAQAPRQQSQPQPQAQVRQQPSVRMQPPTTPSPTVKQPVDANPSNLTGFPSVGNLHMKKPPTGGQPTPKPPFMK